MNPIDKLRYLDASQRRRLFLTGGLFLIAAVVSSTLFVTRCNRAVDVETGRLDSSEQDALAQVREAFFTVQTALVGESPAPTVAEAVRRVASEEGAASFRSKIDQSPLRFNPNKIDWAGGPRGGGPPSGTVLVVGSAPPSQKDRSIVLIGFGRGGIPVEIAAGSEPAWLAKAVTAPE